MRAVTANVIAADESELTLLVLASYGPAQSHDTRPVAGSRAALQIASLLRTRISRYSVCDRSASYRSAR